MALLPRHGNRNRGGGLLAPHCLLLFLYFLLILSSSFSHSYPILFPFVPLCAVRAVYGGRAVCRAV